MDSISRCQTPKTQIKFKLDPSLDNSKPPNHQVHNSPNYPPTTGDNIFLYCKNLEKEKYTQQHQNSKTKKNKNKSVNSNKLYKHNHSNLDDSNSIEDENLKSQQHKYLNLQSTLSIPETSLSVKNNYQYLNQTPNHQSSLDLIRDNYQTYKNTESLLHNLLFSTVRNQNSATADFHLPSNFEPITLLNPNLQDLSNMINFQESINKQPGSKNKNKTESIGFDFVRVKSVGSQNFVFLKVL